MPGIAGTVIDGLSREVINNQAARKMAETLISQPTLINTDATQGAKFAIPLEVETNQMSAQAEVSESLLISKDTKKYVADNVAPGSKTWNLSGWIVGDKQLELTNYYRPIMRLYTDMLWSWFKNGAVLKYMDGSARIYEQVVIKSLQTSQVKDEADAVAFQMTLKEINVMEITETEESVGVAGLTATRPQLGSMLGEPMSLGTVTSEPMVDLTWLSF